MNGGEGEANGEARGRRMVSRIWRLGGSGGEERQEANGGGAREGENEAKGMRRERRMGRRRGRRKGRLRGGAGQSKGRGRRKELKGEAND